MLTPKQHDLLIFIHQRLKATGVSPSYDEMKDALGLQSKSGIHRLISGLEERGFIRRLAHKARAVEILKLPEDMDNMAATSSSAATDDEGSNVVSGHFGKAEATSAPPQQREASNDSVDIPLHGRIAAGTPIEALENTDNFISIPKEMVGKGRYFALEVSGDSMIEEGIYDGDWAIIESSEIARDGQIVVALVENEEATLKFLHRKGPQVILKPANVDYSTQILPADSVRIQGILKGLIRRYH